MDEVSGIEGVGKSLQLLKKQKGLPPVHSWNPPFCGDIDMRIDREGRWHYNGSPIAREKMVSLFATVMRRDDDDYYLVTPVEKVRIQVEDVPFVVIAADVQDGEAGKEYHLTTNIGDQVVVGKGSPILSGERAGFLADMLYVLVRDRLYARVNRNVFYQLVNDAQERVIEEGVELVVSSGGELFSIGVLKEEGE
ncbi:DUF1285 domain-containing protein [Endozoicomonas ascidiicola]|uniref:DUF1285 domain-containing protein n=1 Tax=Endozoicomonas ascidiicola TaxID=1698521 RepID=UPI00082CA708|nr:DUF1285 domain-containing protein [Endozoicomonas ascidiicola]